MPLTCDAGHIPPTWSAAALADRSEIESRCVTTPPDRAPRQWLLCGGLPVPPGATSPVPALCPDAPGGLSVRWGDARAPDSLAAASLLDCPGRYAVTRTDAALELRLVDPSPGACAPYGGQAPSGVRAPDWQPDNVGRALHPVAEVLSASALNLLPVGSRGYITDASAVVLAYGGATTGVLVWEGAVALVASGFQLTVGERGVNNAALSVTEFESNAEISLGKTPVSVRAPAALTNPGGAPLDLHTWAVLSFSGVGTDVEATPLRVGPARACGDQPIAAGTLVTLNSPLADNSPTDAQLGCFCWGDSSTPSVCPAHLRAPDAVEAGPDWTRLIWQAERCERTCR